MVARTGATTGASAYVKDPPDSVFASYLVRLRVSPDADARFVAYFLRSPQYWSYVRGVLGDKSAQPNASAKTLTRAELRVPPLSTQRAIAGVLGALDDKIELNRRMNDTLEALSRQLHTEVIRDAGSRTLGELVLINARKRSRDFKHEQIEYVDISSVKEGHLDLASRVRLEDAPSRAQRLVADGDTIWSCVRPNRKSYAFIDSPPADRVVSTGFAVLTPQAVPAAFLYLAVTTDDFVDYLSANADGSAYPAVRPEHFERAEIPVPDAEALHSFEAMVRPLLARMAHNDRESQTLAELRDVLLPKLISGELRVGDAEAAVDVAEPT